MASGRVKASPSDVAEVLSGKGSSRDKREMGFGIRSGRLVPTKRSPRRLQVAFGTSARQTKRRVVRKRGRSSNQ